jgi:hypothetical protein
MVLMVIIIAGIGYGIARIYRYFVKQQRRGHLEPPVDLLEGELLTVLNEHFFYFLNFKKIFEKPIPMKKRESKTLRQHHEHVTPKLKRGNDLKRARPKVNASHWCCFRFKKGSCLIWMQII